MSKTPIPSEPGADDPAAEWADLARLLVGGEIDLDEAPGDAPPPRHRWAGIAGGHNGFLTGTRASASAIEIAETCHKIPALLPFWTRCGKPTCRCRDGRLHGPFWVLRWRDGATNRRKYVRRGDLAAVRAVLEHRRADLLAVRLLFADDLAMLRRLRHLHREMEAAIAADRRDR